METSSERKRAKENRGGNATVIERLIARKRQNNAVAGVPRFDDHNMILSGQRPQTEVIIRYSVPFSNLILIMLITSLSLGFLPRRTITDKSAKVNVFFPHNGNHFAAPSFRRPGAMRVVRAGCFHPARYGLDDKIARVARISFLLIFFYSAIPGSCRVRMVSSSLGIAPIIRR